MPSFNLSNSKILHNQFLFLALLLVLLHHSRLMLNFVAGQDVLDVLLPVTVDLALLGGLYVISLLAKKYLKNSRLIHVLILVIVMIVVLMGAASLLYEAKTGDTLTFQVVIFGLANLRELAGPLLEELNWWHVMLAILAISAVVVFITNAHRVHMRYLALLTGLGMVSIATNGISYESDVTEKLGLAEREVTFFSRTTQVQWLHDQSSLLHKSMILSLLGYGEGEKSKFNVLQPEVKYSNPSVVAQAGPQPNVLIVTLESTRFSITSPYSEDEEIKALTPNLQKLADEGMVVDHAYTTVPHTSKALVGIFCGQFPRKEIEITEAQPGGLPFNCLPNLMRQAGYETAYFQSAQGSFENRHGLVGNMGFQYTRTAEQLPAKGFPVVGYFGMDDNVMLKPAVDWMKARQNEGKPFFVGMLTVVSHHPYATPHEEPDISTPEKAFEAYRLAVKSTDTFLGNLVASMKREGLLKNTVIVVTGDHGEGFGEHGPRMHNGTAYEEGLRVPMVLYGPDHLKLAGRLGGVRQHIDLLPTVLELAGVRLDNPVPGKSLLSTDGHQQMAMQCWYEDYCAVGMNDNGEKLIYWYGKRSLESFDLNMDSLEKNNLAVQWGLADRDSRIQGVFQQLANLRSIYH